MAVLCLSGCAAAALYVPAEAGLKGIGMAHGQAVGADMRTLEGAAMMFYSEDSAAAASLEEGTNHIGRIARYTDLPAKFDDPSSYALFIVSGGWWIGVAVTDATAREAVAGVASSEGWQGSPDIWTPPSGAAPFSGSDAAAWKKIR